MEFFDKNFHFTNIFIRPIPYVNNNALVIEIIPITDKFQNSVVGGQRMMPWKTVEKIIDEPAEIGVCSLMFSWRGESTLWKDKDENENKIDFGDVLAYARKKKILEITSLTHGQLIDEQMAEK